MRSKKSSSQAPSATSGGCAGTRARLLRNGCRAAAPFCRAPRLEVGGAVGDGLACVRARARGLATRDIFISRLSTVVPTVHVRAREGRGTKNATLRGRRGDRFVLHCRGPCFGSVMASTAPCEPPRQCDSSRFRKRAKEKSPSENGRKIEMCTTPRRFQPIAMRVQF